MRSKKGAAGHVEIIISFLIFIAFVVFLLVFINPIEKTKDNEHYFDITKKAIMEYLEGNLTTFSINFEPNILVAGSCTCILYDFPANVVVKDKDYHRINGITSGNSICIQATAERFYRLYFSEEFAENGGCTGTEPVVSEGYTLGVINKYKKISNKSLYDLEQDYETETGYENLREELNLDHYFNIEVKTTEGEILASGKIAEPEATDIIAEDIPIEVINEGGDIIPAIMNIQVWE